MLPRDGRTRCVAIGRAIAKTIFLSAGNITHTPHYGNLIAMGVLTAARDANAAPHYIANAEAYRDEIARDRRGSSPFAAARRSSASACSPTRPTGSR